VDSKAKALEEALRELEVVKEIEWLSESVICVTLRYPAGHGDGIQVFEANPTLESVKDRISTRIKREFDAAIDPSQFPIEILEELEIRREGADNGERA